MTDNTINDAKSFRLVEILIRFYPLNQRLSAFHSFVCFKMIMEHYFFLCIYVGCNPIKRTDKDEKFGILFLILPLLFIILQKYGYQYATTGKVEATLVASLSANVLAIAISIATSAGLAVRLGA